MNKYIHNHGLWGSNLRNQPPYYQDNNLTIKKILYTATVALHLSPLNRHLNHTPIYTKKSLGDLGY